MLADACWALSHLSDGSTDGIQAVIKADVCRRVVELLMCSPLLLLSLTSDLVSGFMSAFIFGFMFRFMFGFPNFVRVPYLLGSLSTDSGQLMRALGKVPGTFLKSCTVSHTLLPPTPPLLVATSSPHLPSPIPRNRRHPSPSVLIPALRTVGNIVTGNDVQTEVAF